MKKKMRWDEVAKRLPRGVCTAVEVGVLSGKLSAQLLRRCPGLTLLMVDPWKPGEPGTPWWDTTSALPRKPEKYFTTRYRRTVARVAPYGKRARILRTTSLEAAKEVPDGSLDLVFIDGDHSYEAVRADIKAWLPKVRPGGLLSGHDYDYPRFPGVAEAVTEAFGTEAVELGHDRTWFVRCP